MPVRSILLLGDGLRLACQRGVAELVEPEGAAVVWPESGTGSSACLAEGLEDWLARFSPDVAVFGAGPWSREELARPAEVRPEPYGEYQSNLVRITDMLRRACGRSVGFYTMAPIDPHRLALAGPGGTDREDAAEALAREIPIYNRLAMDLLGSLNIMSTDLYVRMLPRADEWLGEDGVELSEAGVQEAAREVAFLAFSVL